MQKIRSKTYDILRWSERYTQTDMVYLAKGSFWLTSAQITNAALSFCLAIVFANFLPKESYGNYKYIMTILAVISTFTLTGLGFAVTESTSKGYDGTIRKAFLMNVKWSIFIFLGCLSAGIYYILQDKNTIGISLLVISFIQPFLKSYELYQAYLNGKKLFKKNAFLSSIRESFVTILLIITAFTSDNVIVLVIIFLFSSLIVNYFQYYSIVEKIPDDSPVDYDSLHFSKHLSLINILLNLSVQLDKIFIFYFLGPAQLAIYVFATAIPKQIRGVMGSIGLLATPKIASKTLEELKILVPKKFLRSLFFLIPIILLYIYVAPYIFEFIFPEYTEAIIFSQIYALYLILLGNTADIALNSLHAKKARYALSIGISVLNIILMFILVQYYGIMGIIISILFTKLLGSSLSLIILKNLK